MDTRIEAHLTKSRRGWSVQTIVHREGWPDSVTHGPARTVASGVYGVVSDAADQGWALTRVTVKGEPYHKIREAVIRSTQGLLSYTRSKCLQAVAAWGLS